MASENSSAVLDLHDDPDETDGPMSLTDGASDGQPPPLIMEHGYDIAVKVDSPMKQMSTLETFVLYRVRCVCARWTAPPFVRRRYNHFKELYKRLCNAYEWVAPPPPPPLHSAREQLDRYSPTFVAIRTLALDAFLNRIAKHPILTHSEDLKVFLTTPDDEIDKVFKSENSALNLWGLSSALYGSGEAKPSNGARVKDPEFTAMSDYLQSLQSKLTTLCKLTTKLYKGSIALSNEYKGAAEASTLWAGAERSVRSPLLGLALAARRECSSRARTSLRQRALAPQLARHAAALANKLRARDLLHAAYVSGSDSSDELHNRLEQASEALRSELTDWNTKTSADVKSLLLELADRQTTIYQQSVSAWEQAHVLALQTDEDIFPTVSKQALQNLSPTRAKQLEEQETDRDFEDLDMENCSNDSEVNSEDKGHTSSDVTDPLRSFADVDLNS